jgi:hypothetical protein
MTGVSHGYRGGAVSWINFAVSGGSVITPVCVCRESQFMQCNIAGRGTDAQSRDSQGTSLELQNPMCTRFLLPSCFNHGVWGLFHAAE